MKTRPYNHEIAETIRDFFRADDLKFRFDEENGIFRYGINMQQVMRTVDFSTRVGIDYFITRAVLPLGVPVEDKELMLRMSEFLHRANYGIKNGNFEFDFRDGEIAYKTYVNCDDGKFGAVMPTTAQVRDSFGMAAMTIEQYAEGIIAVLFKEVSAEDAIAKCEGKHRARMAQTEDDLSERLTEMRERLKALLEGRLNTGDSDTIEAEIAEETDSAEALSDTDSAEETENDCSDDDILAGLDPDAMFRHHDDSDDNQGDDNDDDNDDDALTEAELEAAFAALFGDDTDSADAAED